MKRYAYAWLLAGLALTAPTVLTAQQQDTSRAGQVDLLQNYPNPFNPATTIPFRLSASLFQSGRGPVVSLRIFNVLAERFHETRRALNELRDRLLSLGDPEPPLDLLIKS